MNVLIIENNKADVMLFQAAMMAEVGRGEEQQELRIGVVHSVSEGLKAILAKAYDIILLDLTLPEHDSLDGLSKILNKTNRIPIVVYSNVYSSELARQAISMGAQDYIVKGSMGRTELVRALVHAKIRHDNLLKIRSLIELQ